MTINLRPTAFCTALVVLTLALPASAPAQGFVSPLVGYDFGEDSSCPTFTGCEDKSLNIGVGLGSMGRVLGFELDLSYAKGFFGEAPGYSSSVLTVMSNVLLGPRIGPVRPYGTGGVGLIKSHISTDPAVLFDATNNQFGWNIGGGVMIFATENIGIRGDIRHFHAFQDLEIPGFPLAGTFSGTKLDFARASAALVLRF